MSTGGPDLFVICKSCGSEVSPYITECPYCGNRLRKRAPKLDRDGRVAEKRRRRRPPTPSLPRLRTNEIPGIRPDSHPYATVVLVILGIVGALAWQPSSHLTILDLGVVGTSGGHWWHLFTGAFTYGLTGYAVVVIAATALFGWLIERRHGPIVVVALFLIGAVGGLAVSAAVDPNDLWLGGNGGALALLCAWAVPDLISLRAGEDVEGDLIAALVIALIVAAMPLAVAEASWLSDAVGVVAGFVIGMPLARASLR